MEKYLGYLVVAAIILVAVFIIRMLKREKGTKKKILQYVQTKTIKFKDEPLVFKIDHDCIGVVHTQYPFIIGLRYEPGYKVLCWMVWICIYEGEENPQELYALNAALENSETLKNVIKPFKTASDNVSVWSENRIGIDIKNEALFKSCVMDVMDVIDELLHFQPFRKYVHIKHLSANPHLYGIFLKKRIDLIN